MVKVWNQSSERQRRTARRRFLSEGSKKNLLVRPHVPQLRIRLIDKPAIRDNPLTIKGAKTVTRWRNTRPLFICDRYQFRLIASEWSRDDLLRMFVAGFSATEMRME